MGSVASELKLEREKQKISLAQIAEDTNISLRHLQSIEEGRFSDLPGGMYNRAFLRAYCEILDINQREILQKYDQELSLNTEKPARHKFPAKQPIVSLRPGPFIIWSLIILVCIAGIFFGRKLITAVFSPYISDTSASREDYPPPLPLNAASVAAAVDQAPSVTVEPLAMDKTIASADDAENLVRASIAAAVATDRTSPGTIRLEITGSEQCWISVTPDQNRELTGMIQPGETRSFDAKERIELLVGNAGGITIKINGLPAKPLGNRGEVIRLTITKKTLPDILQSATG